MRTNQGAGVPDNMAANAKSHLISLSAIIDPRARLADGVEIGPGAILNGECEIGANTIIGSGCILEAGSGVICVEPECRIGAGCTIAVPVTIARGSCIEPGAVVARDVPPHAIVSGNPAQITGYTTVRDDASAQTVRKAPADEGQRPTAVRGVTIHRLSKVLDLRGNLSVGEFERSIPFIARRYFLVFGVPSSELRGEHAHRTCHQFLICTHGSCSVLADDGKNREEFVLDDPSIGLHLPPLTWGVQYKYSSDAVLLVFASEFYDTQEYIRHYPEFLELTRET